MWSQRLQSGRTQEVSHSGWCQHREVLPGPGLVLAGSLSHEQPGHVQVRQILHGNLAPATWRLGGTEAHAADQLGRG